MPEADINKLDVEILIAAALEGGEKAKAHFGSKPRSWQKEDASPVSVADVEVDNFLRETLMGARPDYGWLSEETEDNTERLKCNRTFVVDPIDGTRAFLEGGTEWCLSLAVVQDGRPVVGVIYCPMREQLFVAIQGRGATLNGEPTSVSQKEETRGARVVAPGSFFNRDSVKGLELSKQPYLRSLAYRIVMVAAGELEASVTRSKAQDWDLAAADVILQESGGRVVSGDGSQLLYNKSAIKQPALIASSDRLVKKLQGIVEKN
ncbi:3'(2'),5'-bisphosphate nucleotidase CysQ [Flexibacterium corallicola]|uniref:3'(2'),5'-bisphosphate nucleotidase CysQ n=1 Tax=Flexibacterium corallicola TaxID=3037259 RepID=UPI00286F32FC|nr:3'(2'),5'-bisphosphate nucleotidase CysQ [Pseudovibrio sp. M1P-2-3]